MAANIVLRMIHWVRAQVLYQAVLTFIGVSIVIPTVIYFVVVDLAEEPTEEISTCVIQYDYRVPCGFVPGREMGNLTSYDCRKMGCCFDDFTKTCFHYFPSKYGYHKVQDNAYYTSKRVQTPLGNLMYANVSIAITSNENYIEASLKRILVPQKAKSRNIRNFPDLTYSLSESDLALNIYRSNYPDVKILETSRGPLIASDGYWEWTVQLTNRNGTMYGLGGLEIIGNVTKVIHKNEIDQSNIPFFIAQQETPNGVEYHALLVEHQGLLEVQVLESKLIIFRALNVSETGLTLKFFPGPTLKDIQKQTALNNQPETIPRWLLGTHICRNNVTDLGTMLLEFANEQQFNTLQADSDCFNELLMILLIEMYDDQLPARKSHTKDMIAQNLRTKFVLPLTPHIPIGVDATETEEARNYSLFTTAFEMDVLLKNETQIQVGDYKNRKVAFFDPRSANAVDYLKKLLDAVEETIIPVSKIDGVFLLDNWPQDDSYNFTAETQELLYYNNEIAMALNKTPPMLMTDQENYVRKQVEVVRAAINKDIPILSASHYYEYRSPLLPQHINKSWANLKESTTRALFTNIFMHPVALSPVCGTDSWLTDTAHENELCARWFINQATLPGQRMTMNWYTHENFTFSSRNIVDKALELKQMLSYYQYTHLREIGHTVSPMFMDFPDDNVTWSLDDQYMLGNLLVVPIFLPQTTMRRFYLPSNISWYEFWGGLNYKSGWTNMSVSNDERMIFVKEGTLVPILKEKDKELYFELKVYKSCNVGRDSIHGTILFDDYVLQLSVFDRFIEVSNILNVQLDVDCTAEIKNHAHRIKKLQMFDCKSKEIVFEFDFDICSETNQDTEKIVIN